VSIPEILGSISVFGVNERAPGSLFPTQPETRVSAVMTQQHGPHAIKLFVKKQVVGSFSRLARRQSLGSKWKRSGCASTSRHVCSNFSQKSSPRASLIES
jgi:hypothetical protein